MSNKLARYSEENLNTLAVSPSSRQLQEQLTPKLNLLHRFLSQAQSPSNSWLVRMAILNKNHLPLDHKLLGLDHGQQYGRFGLPFPALPGATDRLIDLDDPFHSVAFG